MTKEQFFETFDTTASVKTSIAIACIRKAKTIGDARWHAIETMGELQGLYRGYTEAGEMIGICKTLDDVFLERMFYYRQMIEEELGMFMAKRSKRK